MGVGDFLSPETANYWSGQQGGALGGAPVPTMAAANPLAAFGISAGSSLLSGLGSALFPSWGTKKKKEVFSMAQNRLGQNVLNPEQYLADYQRALAPRFNQQADAMNRRLGLDSGVAQGELGFQMQFPLAQFMFEAKQQNDMLKSQRDSQLMQLMGSLTA